MNLIIRRLELYHTDITFAARHSNAAFVCVCVTRSEATSPIVASSLRSSLIAQRVVMFVEKTKVRSEAASAIVSPRRFAPHWLLSAPLTLLGCVRRCLLVEKIGGVACKTKPRVLFS